MRVRVKVRVRVRVVVGAEVAPAPVVGEEQQHVRSGDEHRRSQQEEHLARGGGAEGRSGLLAEAEEVAAGDGAECLSGVVLPNLRGGQMLDNLEDIHYLCFGGGGGTRTG